MKEPVSVEFVNLTKIFTDSTSGKEVKACDDFSFFIRGGELVTLLGPSGCGKTTVLRMLAGFETPTSGDIKVGGKSIKDVPPNKRNSTMVFQSYALFPHMDVEHNIAFGLKLRKLGAGSMSSRLKEVIEMVGLSGYGKRRPSEISGGQQQRVALARALVVEPDLLLFDEPLSNLDAKLRETMRIEIRRIQKSLGITAVYVTHDQVEAMAISDKVIVMRNGKMVQAGKPWEIYQRPASRFVADFMGAANFTESVLKEIEGNIARIELGKHLVEIPYVAASASKDRIASVVLRPENIILMPKRKSPYSGVITERSHLGHIMEYRVKSESLGALTVRELTGSSDFYEVGEEVSIELKYQNLHYLLED